MAACFAFALEPRGLWLTEGGDAKIQIWDQNGKLYGKIVWLKNPLGQNGKPKADLNNPKESLRNRPILGLPLLMDLKPVGSDQYEGGRIYDPKSGKTYDCQMEQLSAQTLSIRGYLGISLLGRTQKWQRVP